MRAWADQATDPGMDQETGRVRMGRETVRETDPGMDQETGQVRMDLETVQATVRVRKDRRHRMTRASATRATRPTATNTSASATIAAAAGRWRLSGTTTAS